MVGFRGLALIAAFTAATSHAAVLFEDDFCTADNWVPLNIIGASVAMDTGDCDLKVTVTGESGGMLKHDMVLPETFTYSVTLNPSGDSYTRVGLIYCYGDPLSGYVFTITPQQRYEVFRMESGRYTPLVSNAQSSAITAGGANTLTVSKSPGGMTLFCNDTFLRTLEESTLTGGCIGLLVSGGAPVTFSHAMVTDREQTGSAASCMQDDFDGPLNPLWENGWVRGTYELAEGECVLDNTDTRYSSYLLARGDFAHAPLRATVTGKGGEGMYGIGFFDFVQSGTTFSYQTLALLIDAQRRYAIVEPGATSFQLSQPTTHLRPAGSANRLAMEYEGGEYVFYANGNRLTSVSVPTSFELEAAALQVQHSTSAGFDDFAVGTEQCLANPIRHFPIGRPRAAVARGTLSRPVVFDLRGRSVGRFAGCGAGRPRAHLSKGVYLLIGAEGPGGSELPRSFVE